MPDLGRRLIFDAESDAIRPDPSMSVSAWADGNRVLDGSSASEPGQWRTSRTPYLREIMDRMGADDPCEVVVVMKAAQVGGSEAMNNALGYYIDVSPSPVLLVEPTVETVERYSKQRIAPMIEACPTLKAKVAPAKEKASSNTMLVKSFRGGLLILTGANSAAALRSMPIRRVLFDEVDAYPANLDDEGDPVKLGEQRTATFAGRKVVLVSTPLVRASSRIEAAYLRTDQRRYFVPCPHCAAMQALRWESMRWDRKVDPATNATMHDPDSAWYECEACKGRIEERHKPAMLAGGEWRATADADGRSHGYHISALYSPAGWTSWVDLVREYVEAHGDPTRMQAFVNMKLGETWDPLDGDKVDGADLAARAEVYDFPAPHGVALVTVGADVQDDRIEAEVVGWGVRGESWSLGYVVLHGDPAAPADTGVWRELDDLLTQTWQHASGVDLHVSAACVDSGGHHTMAVYAFVRPRAARRVWAIKGMAGQGRAIWPRRPSRNNKGKIDLYPLGVDSAKEELYARLRLTTAGPGFCHFPADRPLPWFQGLTSERPVRRYVRGHAKIEWHLPSHARNEPLDCRVYATAALHGWLATGRKVETELARLGDVPQDQRPRPATPPRKAWLDTGGVRPRDVAPRPRRSAWL